MSGFQCDEKTGSDIQNELNSSDWQHAFVSRNQTAPLVCASTISEHYTEEQTLLTRKEPKKLIPHWPLTSGTKGLPCVHTEGVQAHFMIPLCALLLITSPPSYGHREPPFSRRQTRHHSFTCLLGAFVRWLLAEKGKQINTSPMGLTGNLYLGWNMSTSRPDSLTVTGQLTSCTEALFPCY